MSCRRCPARLRMAVPVSGGSPPCRRTGRTPRPSVAEVEGYGFLGALNPTLWSTAGPREQRARLQARWVGPPGAASRTAMASARCCCGPFLLRSKMESWHKEEALGRCGGRQVGCQMAGRGETSRRTHELEGALKAVLSALQVAFLPKAGAQGVPRGDGARAQLDRGGQLVLRALVVLVQHVQRPPAKQRKLRWRRVCGGRTRSQEAMARSVAGARRPRHAGRVAPRRESIAARARSLRSWSSLCPTMQAALGQRR